MLKAIDDERIECFYKAQVAAVERAPEGSERPYVLVLATGNGEARVPCNRIIARIGAVPPRKFVESCGIKFPSADRGRAAGADAAVRIERARACTSSARWAAIR